LILCNVLNEDLENSLEKLKLEFEVLDIVYCDGNVPTVDLYIRVEKLRRERFENNQRIVFVITEDTDSHGTAGQTLQNIQSIINEVDISNCFVCLITTNSDVTYDYQYVLDNISQDPVPFSLYRCQGNYKKISKDNNDVFSKFISIKTIAKQVDKLREDQKYLLLKNKTFCMLAWTGINIEPTNVVRPCCQFKGDTGRSDKDSLAVIWNSDAWKKVRKDMLDGTEIPACQRCYYQEKIGKETLRQYANRLLIDKINVIDHTHDDGYLEVFNLNYWDVRYNNLCNLACRSCSPRSSSSWYEPAVALGQIKKPRTPILQAGRDNHDIFNQIIQHIDHVEQIVFAGGEPSMIDNFYEVLEILDARGRNDVKLYYNINMSRLTLKNKSLLNLWKKFPNVSIGASLDGEYKRGEYLRQGLDWKDVIKNRKLIQDQCPHIDFYICATVNILNVLHLPEFHKSWVDLGLISPKDFDIQILFFPAYLRVDHSPVQLKEKIRKVYNDHIDWLSSKDSLGRAIHGFQSVLSHIEHEHDFNTLDFWNNVDSLDRYHKTCMIDVFPELAILPRQ
jgi:MoaA/NifB/PqqE/SkfB family radical SAM enzyme